MAATDVLRSKVVEWAAQAPENRDRLLQDPTAAVEEVLEIEVPEGTVIEVLEETANHYYLVLPPRFDPSGPEPSVEGYKY